MSLILSDNAIAELRRDTPATLVINHLNHAGSSLPPRPVLNTQIEFLRREAEIGGYEAADELSERDLAVYESIARLLGADASEIARAEHATSAWNSGFWAVPMREGQRIITAEAAYGANAVAFLRARETRGVTIDVVPSDAHGQVDLQELENRLDGDVALVAITHIPTNGGLINPAASVGRLTKAAGVPFLLDACQSVGQLDLDVDELGCDMLTVTGRKYLRGPRGSGFLYVSSSIVESLHPDHPDHHGADWNDPDHYTLEPGAKRFEYWEYDHAAWLALGQAVDYAIGIGLGQIEATVKARADQLRALLTEAEFPVHDVGETKCGLVTTTVPDVDPFVARDALRAQNINVSVTTSTGALWDFTRRSLPPMLRLSVHYLTTPGELDQVVTALKFLGS